MRCPECEGAGCYDCTVDTDENYIPLLSDCPRVPCKRMPCLECNGTGLVKPRQEAMEHSMSEGYLIELVHSAEDGLGVYVNDELIYADHKKDLFDVLDAIIGHLNLDATLCQRVQFLPLKGLDR